MKSNLDDKVVKLYVIAAIISVVTIIRSPEIIIAILYGGIVEGGPIDHWYLVMHLMGLTFMMIIAIVYNVSRGKHAHGQPPLKRERYILDAAIIAFMIIYAVAVIYVIGINGPPGRYIISHFERIKIESASVSKSIHTYFIYITFANTGNTDTSIDSILLNGLPYDDSGWAGTIKPTVFGDITSGTFIKAEGSSDPLGIIYFSDDCVYIPSGYRFAAGVTVKITIHTIGGKDYETSVTLP